MRSIGATIRWPVSVGLAVVTLALATATTGFGDDKPAANAAPATTAEQAEFFEKRIRPLLVENCHRCHSDREQKGGLRLDSRSAILAGGDSGAAIVPGSPDESLAVEAIRYGADSYQMPPTGKLAAADIEFFERWVADGAPWPGDHGAEPVAAAPSDFDLAERANHWAYQPIVDAPPPAVRDEAWTATPVDRFILAGLEAEGLSPAPSLERAAWLRRVTFDLVGLPPTPAELNEFLADVSSEAESRVVERLLASPHYGERWGRHWLDLVRYGDTMGHEFDYELFHAWRYRDYVVRAFNADVPYDQFVVEHLAGDLLAEPRRDPRDGVNQSVLGTGFYWLAEAAHSPVDVRQTQADRIDNQIDVLGKTFLGQTIACARCHDHKFDAIRTRDYYALAGYLKSSRYQQAPLDPPERIAEPAARLSELHEAAATLLVETLMPQWRRQAEQTALCLLAARDVSARLAAAADEHDRTAIMARLARERGLDPAQLDRWLTALADPALDDASHPWHVWRALATADEADEYVARRDQLSERLHSARASWQAHYDQLKPVALAAPTGTMAWDEWFATGDVFRGGFPQSGQLLLAEALTAKSDADLTRLIRFVPSGQADTRALSRRLEGVLRSPTFTIESRYVHVLAAGRGSRINVIVDGFALIRDPIYGGLSINLDDDRLTWRTIDVDLWRAHRAYVELVDSPVPNPTQTLSASVVEGRPSDGFLVVQDVRVSDEPAPATRPCGVCSDILVNAPESMEALAARYQSAVVETLQAVAVANDNRAPLDEDRVELINWMTSWGLLDSSVGESASSALAPLAAQYREAEASIPAPRYGLATADGTGEDEHVFVRGNYRVLGEPAPRGLLDVLAGQNQPAPAEGSGRLDLAGRLADPQVNPLLARVMVNRLWQHHFGRGLVATPDDFGHMGEPPTHPELLDFLASRFIESGWSVKAMHRLIVFSAAYHMSSNASDEAVAIDATNRLWHHVPLRRLEAEAVRDAILAVSGRLDPTMGGPPVMPYIEASATDRGKPKQQGPLDGDGRRTIYLGVRRNFLSPLLMSFDFPRPISTIGRRGASNTPAQALALLNNPFVIEQAHVWAERLLVESPGGSASERVGSMYRSAFSRSPEDGELIAALDFLARRMAAGDDELTAYGALAHALLNTKEFVFLE